jgi:hypothetical protein
MCEQQGTVLYASNAAGATQRVLAAAKLATGERSLLTPSTGWHVSSSSCLASAVAFV